MNRRHLLKTGIYAGALSVLPFSNAFSQSNNSAKNNDDTISGFKKLKLGDLDLYLLTDGYIRDTDVTHFCPRGNVTELIKILRDNFRPTDYIDCAMNVLLVKTKERLILFDTGWGVFADNKTKWLPARKPCQVRVFGK